MQSLVESHRGGSCACGNRLGEFGGEQEHGGALPVGLVCSAVPPGTGTSHPAIPRSIKESKTNGSQESGCVVSCCGGWSNCMGAGLPQNGSGFGLYPGPLRSR